ncbi:hypothetical protein LVJ94_37340 [Pendulispora rubella]|uniref:Uncharacterized protein n=1 Tax=Pendulispora rubella TaxID=2741070 RepID=A0ABZ2KVP7_9BACT
MWRAEDEALLSRLEDERILERLWLATTGRRAPHPARAAGLIACIARMEAGRRAREAADRGELELLVHVVREAPLEGMPPELLHHLALHLTRVAEAICEETPDAASDARLRALAAWLALVHEHRYLSELARAVAGSQLSPAELERAVDDAALDVIERLGREAEEGARSRTQRARAAWRTLARVAEACRVAGLATSAGLARRAMALADSKRRHALDAALSSIAEAMADASARGSLSGDALRILHPATTLWSWAEYDEAVERFVIDQVGDAAWELYRENRWDDLRALMATIDPLVDSLCRRIEENHEPMGYLASCAHMLIFRAETATTLSDQIALAEKALAICPSHRNARIVLCSYLCRQAIHTMERTGFFVGEKDIAAMEAMLGRAEGLNPTSRSLEEARRRLAAFKQRAYRRTP